jgi:hypothetical protein
MIPIGCAHDSGEKINVLIVSICLPIGVGFTLRSNAHRAVKDICFERLGSETNFRIETTHNRRRTPARPLRLAGTSFNAVQGCVFELSCGNSPFRFSL